MSKLFKFLNSRQITDQIETIMLKNKICVLFAFLDIVGFVAALNPLEYILQYSGGTSGEIQQWSHRGGLFKIGVSIPH